MKFRKKYINLRRLPVGICWFWLTAFCSPRPDAAIAGVEPAQNLAPAEAAIQAAAIQAGTWPGYRAKHAKMKFAPAGVVSKRRLAGMDLSNVDFSNLALIHVSLAGANLTDAILAGQDYSQTDFRGANLTRTIFAGSDLRFADMRGARFDETVFARIEDGTNPVQTDLRGVDFTGTDLARAVLGVPNPADRALLVCRLTGAKMAGARIALKFKTGVLAQNVHGAGAIAWVP